MTILNDICHDATELYGNEERSKDYLRLAEKEFDDIEDKFMPALIQYYGNNKANLLYDEWINSFYAYHHKMRIMDFSIGLKYGLELKKEIDINMILAKNYKK